MIRAMASFESTFPGRPGSALRQLLFRVMDDVYTENADRLDSAEGDKNYAFAGVLRDNIPHRLAIAVQGFERLHGMRARVVDGRGIRLTVGDHTVCFYKAPPGARGLGDLTFDNSDYKQYLVHRNASHGQRTIDFRGGDEAGIDIADAEVDIVVVAHFGNLDSGLERAVIGVPYEVEGVVVWDWSEDLFDDGEDYAIAPEQPDSDGPAGVGDPFGLQLRRDDRSGER